MNGRPSNNLLKTSAVMHFKNISIRPLQRLTQTAVALALTLGCGASFADDTEVYSGISNTPKVLFVLDVSGSMVANKDGYTTTRLDRMKAALSTLLKDLQGVDVDVGLMSFTASGSRSNNTVPKIDLLHPVVDVVDYQDTLQGIVDGLTAGGWTPTVSALYEASLYMRGEAPHQGVPVNGQATYDSPITKECESGHIVLLTDGVPIGDNDIADHLRSLQCDTTETYSSAVCGVELTEDLASRDQLSLPGRNTITTHTIGFNLNSDWVPRLADKGDGVYSDAKSTQDLLDAFEEILDSVELASAASAPTVSVNAFNESRHRDELYYSFFQPYRKPRWDGNVKKYRFVDGIVVDKNDDPVLDDNGLVSVTSQSLWSSGIDGENVADGGMGAKQPAGRQWYTDAGVAEVNGSITPFLVTDYADVSIAAMDADSEQDRDNLLNWVRGFDDSNPPGANKYVADSLHSSPVLVTYKAHEADDILEEAVFTTNNMGVLHAVHADTGDELWSYSPEELLPNIKKYYDNDYRDSHIYGLDGPIVVHSKKKVNTTLDHELDKAWLYLSQRRGGNDIYALDVSNAMKPSNPPFEVMWKINGGVADTDFRDLGQTWATPQVIPIRYGCPNDCEVKEVLMFGGGYNPVYDDKDLVFPVSAEATGHGNAIYMVDPETGDLIWSAGNGSHHELDLPEMNDSIPTTPVPVDTNADGVVDILFASDVAGRVWRIDLKRDATSKQELAIGGGLLADLNQPGQALRFFNRVDAVISGTTEGAAYFNLVLGTGMRSSPLYDEPVDNRLFVLKDPHVFSYPKGDDVDVNTGELLPRYEYVEGANDNWYPIRPDNLWEFGTPETAGGRRYGYYSLFSETGEKILQPTLTHGGRIFVVSYVPPDASSLNDSCNYNLGESRLHILDLADGTPLALNPPRNYTVVGNGIISIGSIIDTGDGSGESLLTGLEGQKLIDLLGPTDSNIFRRFIRTGWLEKDDY